MIRLLKSQSGYSLVEVMVSILLLSVAIIPMVGMFDAGLRAATSSGNYDKARALANQQLERAKNLPYGSASATDEDVKDNFPSEAASGKGAPDSDGEVTSSAVAVPGSAGLPAGSTFVVTKRYLEQPEPGAASQNFDNSASASDTRLLKITVAVNWSGNSYTTSGVVVG